MNEEDQSVLNPFKATFWTISGLEKAKSMIEAFHASKIGSVKYPKFVCKGSKVLTKKETIKEYSN